MNNQSPIRTYINSLVEVHASVSGHYATKDCKWPLFMDTVHDELLKVIFGLRQMASLDVTTDLLKACIQARAALPDAWFAVQCNVPQEIVDLLNNAIFKAETAGYESKAITSWNYLHHGPHVFFLQENWRNEVANEDTILGYQDWVEHKHESMLYEIDLEGVDAVEVAGCTETEGIVEVKDERDAEFFSVYTHRPNEGVECVCDFNIKAQAIEFAKALAARTGIPVYGNMCNIGGL